MEHSGQKKILIILLSIVIAGAAWYCFSHITGNEKSTQGTLVQAAIPAADESMPGDLPAWMISERCFL